MSNKQRKIVPQNGDLFAVPLRGGSFGLMHIVHMKAIGKNVFSITCGFFPYRANSVEELAGIAENVALSRPVVVTTITQQVVVLGEWQRIGNRITEYQNVEIKPRLKTSWDWVDGKQRDPEWILDMYHGLYPWDGFADPQYLDKLLTPGTVKPSSARNQDEFTEEELRALGIPPHKVRA